MMTECSGGAVHKVPKNVPIRTNTDGHISGGHAVRITAEIARVPMALEMNAESGFVFVYAVVHIMRVVV